MGGKSMMKDLKLSAELLQCKIRSNGDTDLNGNKLHALFCCDTGKRVTPFYSLSEWSKLNVAKVMLDYLKNK